MSGPKMSGLRNSWGEIQGRNVTSGCENVRGRRCKGADVQGRNVRVAKDVMGRVVGDRNVTKCHGIEVPTIYGQKVQARSGN